MRLHKTTSSTLVTALAVGGLCVPLIALAWTPASGTAPSNDASSPINVSSTAQVKNGNLGLNGLAVFGNSILQASSYLNWGATAGNSGYGIWDNAGTLNFKNAGGSQGCSVLNEGLGL